ncbi:carbonic anhydrase [Methylomonas koyamae]|uniref:Carbonic anhydrase n=1 Tax=Methylomonas koyamae TaxID=702114 RepID=A0A291IGA9_9GAMM|nr:carbonic anhydrase [Methylomonas koyamae]ATG89342.1 carbonic anhydrase [Methylomonas koyamae]OAI29826.1 carbonic anhydrase [Methylomonas koyamae]WNB76981.1 carbonic anhydrase [Methylomonas koyamae]
MQTPAKLLLENKAWSEAIVKQRPDYFKTLAKEQRPEFLWIGCADSRVPADTIVKAEPGEIFVHRNIANQVITTDFNGLSVLQYAVNVLKVKHVIVCGHYGCGGVEAALHSQRGDLAIANKWLSHIKEIYRLYQDELDNLPPRKRVDRLVEWNVIEQVHRLAHTSIVQAAWDAGQPLSLRGWVYGLSDGLLNELVHMDQKSSIHEIYQYAG